MKNMLGFGMALVEAAGELAMTGSASPLRRSANVGTLGKYGNLRHLSIRYCRILPLLLMMDSSTNLEPERMPGLNPTK